MKLISFAKEIISLVEELKITPTIYGSYAYAFYTKEKIKINDIDLLLSEKDFVELIKILKLNKIKYKYNKKWHTLQITKGKLRLEIDSIDFWSKIWKIRIKSKRFNFYGKKINIISLDNLKKIYKKASEISEDNPYENKNKFEALKKIT